MLEINKNKLVPGIVATWGDITGNISNQADLVEYVSTHGGGDVLWGSISGNISDQADLMNLVSSFATESWVSAQGYLTAVPSEYATESWVQSQGYLTSETLPSDLATESWVLSQSYITSDALSGYATESWVSSQQFVTSSILSSYAAKEDAPVSGLYVSNPDVPSQYNGYGSVYMRVEVGSPGTPSMMSGYMTGVSAPFGAGSATANRNVYVLNGDVYGYNYSDSTGYIYKYDNVTSQFIPYVSVTGETPISAAPLWADNSGRVYYGIYYTVNMSTGEFSSWDPGIVSTYYYSAETGRQPIVYVGSSIYFVSSVISYGGSQMAVLFNEATQQFDSYIYLGDPRFSLTTWYTSSGVYNGDTYFFRATPYQDEADVFKLCSSVQNGSVSLYFESLPKYPSDPADPYYGNPMAYLISGISAPHVHQVTLDGSTYTLCFRTTQKMFISDYLSYGYTDDSYFWSTVSMSGYFGTSNYAIANTGCTLGSLTFGYFYSNVGSLKTTNTLIVTSFNYQSATPSTLVESYFWNSTTLSDIFSTMSLLSARLSSVESSVDSALTITSNILGV